MRRKLRATLILLFLTMLALTTESKAASVRVDSVFRLFDRELTAEKDFRAEKEKHLEALRSDLARTGSFATAEELFDEYRAYQSDSAFLYAKKMLHISEKTGEKSHEALAKAAFADYFISVGLFKEASEMIAMINGNAIPAEKRPAFYSLAARLYQSLESYVGGPQSEIWPYYNHLRTLYLDSLLAVAPEGSYLRDFASIERRQIDGLSIDDEIAMRLGLLARHRLDDHEKAINHSLLGHAYLGEGKRDEAKYHFALSAIYDNRSNTTETTSATMLARMLHEEGDNERAFTYINKALSDATFFNTRLRKYEISGEMPAISAARFDWISGKVWRLWIVSGIIFVLLVTSLGLFRQLLKRSKALEQINRELDKKTAEITESHQRLEQTNELLGQTVSKLRETTEIKDQYIMQSLYVNTAFVNHVETKCREAAKAAKEGRIEPLKFLAYEMGIKEERQRIYRSFDSAFLKLFPNFIDEINALLPEEEKISAGPEGELPMDIRIFALLRLGISDPAEVARYLNLSTKTVYVYKTKLKSKATVDNQEFEARIMAIKKP